MIWGDFCPVSFYIYKLYQVKYIILNKRFIKYFIDEMILLLLMIIFLNHEFLKSLLIKEQ